MPLVDLGLMRRCLTSRTAPRTREPAWFVGRQRSSVLADVCACPVHLRWGDEVILVQAFDPVGLPRAIAYPIRICLRKPVRSRAPSLSAELFSRTPVFAVVKRALQCSRNKMDEKRAACCSLAGYSSSWSRRWARTLPDLPSPQLLGLPGSENELRPERAIPPSVTITLPITSAHRARLGIAFPHAPHVEHKAIVAEDAKPLSLRPPTHSLQATIEQPLSRAALATAAGLLRSRARLA